MPPPLLYCFDVFLGVVEFSTRDINVPARHIFFYWFWLSSGSFGVFPSHAFRLSSIRTCIKRQYTLSISFSVMCQTAFGQLVHIVFGDPVKVASVRLCNVCEVFSSVIFILR